jgi:hypothetical protein
VPPALAVGDRGRRQRPPAITLPQQHDEVGFDAGLLAARDLVQADLHGLLVERRFVAYSPAKVDGLKARVVRLAQLAQPWEDIALQCVALGFQILKSRADKDSECACRGRHRTITKDFTPGRLGLRPAARRNNFIVLRNRTECPEGLRKYWMEHADKSSSYLYDKIEEDVEFRGIWADKCGFGFELSSVVPNIPKNQVFVTTEKVA